MDPRQPPAGGFREESRRLMAMCDARGRACAGFAREMNGSFANGESVWAKPSVVVVGRRDETLPANTPVLLLSASVKNGIESERTMTTTAALTTKCQDIKSRRFAFVFCFFIVRARTSHSVRVSRYNADCHLG